MTSKFPERLRKLRERQGVTMKALGERCGISKNMIAVYERGESEPTASVLTALADCFGVTVDYLLGYEKNF